MRRVLVVVGVCVGLIGVGVPAARGASSGAFVSVGDGSVLEGNSTSRVVKFPVTLSRPATATVTVQYMVVDGTARGGPVRAPQIDYRSKQGTLTFKPTTTGFTPIELFVSVAVYGESLVEPDERFSVVLSNPTGGYVVGRGTGTGTIMNDDGIASGVTVGLGESSIVVSSAGKATLSVPVTLSSAATVTVTFAVKPGSATYSATKAGGGDYGGKTGGTLTFRSGTVAKTISVPVWPHPGLMSNRTLGVTLSGLTGSGVTLLRPTSTETLLGGGLRNIASTRGLIIGSAARSDALASDPQYGPALAHDFSMLVPENELKWDTIEPQPGVYNFGPADQLATFATTNNMQVRGTPLVWYFQNPSWLTNGNWTPATLGQVLDDHIANLVGHYAGTVKQWDVVNEAFNDDGTLRSSMWTNALGASYIDRAFQDAHAADPTAELFYNDYNIEWSNPKADAVYAMVASMKQRGIPIDGVGFQMHALEGFPTATDLQQQFARYAAIGVDVAITELDVRIPIPNTASDLQSQAQTYHDTVAACLTSSNCHTLLVWGFTDRYSWIPAFFPGYGAADLYDTDYGPKAAQTAVVNALNGH